MLALKTISFNYGAKEDRILAAINAGSAEAWSGWLTRRLVLNLLARASEFLVTTSPLAKKASPDNRQEVAAFERDAAIAKTAPAMSPTPPTVFKASAPVAELVLQIKISSHGERCRLEIQGYSGGGAAAMVGRAELQRILQMLQSEVAKAEWQGPAAKPPAAPAVEQSQPKPARH